MHEFVLIANLFFLTLNSYLLFSLYFSRSSFYFPPHLFSSPTIIMYIISSFVSTVIFLAVLAVSVQGLPAAEAPVAGSSSKALQGDNIARLDAASNCLSKTLTSMSGQNRLVLDSLAHELQSSPFRDFHQFAPAAMALGQKDIESKILGTDFTQTIKGLQALQSYFKNELPQTVEAAASHSGRNAEEIKCSAPTAKNLNVIYVNLDKLAKQFQ